MRGRRDNNNNNNDSHHNNNNDTVFIDMLQSLIELDPL